MSNLPLDMPDNYPLLPGSGKSPSSDIGELAVRLGSIVSYDRRGVVIFSDDFQSGIGGYEGLTLTNGAALDLSATRAISKGFSCRITTQQTAQNLSGIQKTLHPLNLLRTGVEFSFSENSGLKLLRLSMYYQTNNIQLSGFINYDFTDNTIKYFDPSNGFILLDTVKTLTADSPNFSVMKLVIDPLQQTYGRLLFNRNEYDLESVSMDSNAFVLSDRIIFSILVSSNSNASKYLYLDNVIATIGEL